MLCFYFVSNNLPHSQHFGAHKLVGVGGEGLLTHLTDEQTEAEQME